MNSASCGFLFPARCARRTLLDFISSALYAQASQRRGSPRKPVSPLYNGVAAGMILMSSISFRVRRGLANLGVIPRSRLSRFALLFLALDLLLYVVQRIQIASGHGPAASALDGWVVLLTITNLVLYSILGLRWIRHKLLWRLRNRLIVTYVFIGVIPVLLIGAMVFFASYLFAGQFAALLARSDIDAEISGLQTVNSTIAAELDATMREGGKVSEDTVEAVLSGAKSQFARTEVQAWYRGRPLLTKSGKNQNAAMVLPDWLKSGFAGMVYGDDHKLYIRVVSMSAARGAPRVVISSLPLDSQTLAEISGNLGRLSIFTGSQTIQTGTQSLHVGISDNGRGRSDEDQVFTDAKLRIEGGVLPPENGRLDKQVAFGTLLPVTDWSNGKEYQVLVQVSTMTSILYRRLFSSFSQLAELIRLGLVALAIFLAVIELFALMIGLGLTRTITRSVAALYRGTQSVNRGNFSHRIQVKSRDQLAALETSFNSMTGSLEKLISEQKEKQRLESELAIAQEVQGQLFPRSDVRLPSLELHGVCRPARTVSGDYYDFLRLGPERLALAVGDISGKGISAALLMATIHSAVRVYEFGGIPDEQVLAAAGVAAIAASRSMQGIATRDFAAGNGGGGIQSPSDVMWLLNRHLFHSTPAEKYATMFLCIYDGDARRLTYCNAGHLQPLILGSDGRLRRLDQGGTVIGLFEQVEYDESSVVLSAGDLLVAYSDGITEPENEFGEFGEARLLEVLRENQRLPLPRLSEAVITAVLDWTGGGEQPDDITLVLARAC